MYLLAPFILQNFKNILRADPELPGCAIFRPKMALLSSTKNFWYKTLLLLSSTYWPFPLCKILKNSSSRSRVMMCHFWGQNGAFASNIYFFFLKITNIILVCLLALFIVQNFKTIIPVDPEFWGCAIFGPKMAHFFKWDFFQKTC